MFERMKNFIALVCGFAALFSLNADAGSVRGTVFLAEEEVPADGAVVSLGRSYLEGITDSLGIYQIDGIDPGMYLIDVHYPGIGRAAVVAVPVTDYATTRFNFLPFSECGTSYHGDVLNGRMIGMNEEKRLFAFSPFATEVDIRVIGDIQEVSVSQSFQNTSSEALTVGFIFPAAYYCFVNSFRAAVGGRSVVGEYVFSDVAEEENARAVGNGRTSPLLVVDRPYAFNRILGELEAGEWLDVDFSYLGPVTQNHDQFEITFPMADEVEGFVLSEEFRYGVPSVLVPGEDIAISIEIHAGLRVVDTESVFLSGTVEDFRGNTQHLPGTRWVPGTDYMLRYALDNSKHSAGALTADGCFMLALEPEFSQLLDPSSPKEYMFVVDCSSYLNSNQLFRAESFIMSFLELLQPEDEFQIVRLGEEGCFFSNEPVPPIQESIRYAQAYLHSLSVNSMILNAELSSVFTDSVFGEKERILVLLASGNLVDSPEFYMALEETPSAFLSAWFVNLGNNSSENFHNSVLAQSDRMMMLEAHHDPRQVAQRVWERVNGACLEDAVIDWGECSVFGEVPGELPVLYQSAPVFVFGRYEGDFPTSLVLSGTMGDRIVELSLPVDIGGSSNEEFLADAWAFSFCEDAGNRSFNNLSDSLMFRDIALEYSLQTNQTAMLLFDEEDGECVSIFPRDVRYDEILGGCIAGPYVSNMSRAVLTMQPPAREAWSTLHFCGFSYSTVTNTSYWLGEDRVSTGKYFYSSPGIFAESGTNGSVSLVSLSWRGEELDETEIEDLAQLMVSSAAETYSCRSDLADILMVFEGGSLSIFHAKNEKAIQGSEADSLFVEEVINGINDLRFETSSSVRGLKAALLFIRK